MVWFCAIFQPLKLYNFFSVKLSLLSIDSIFFMRLRSFTNIYFSQAQIRKLLNSTTFLWFAGNENCLPCLDDHEKEWDHTSGSDSLSSDRYLECPSTFLELPKVMNGLFFFFSNAWQEKAERCLSLLAVKGISLLHQHFCKDSSWKTLPRFHSLLLGGNFLFGTVWTFKFWCRQSLPWDCCVPF